MIDPTGATAGDVLTYNNSTNTWVASAAPTGGNDYTTVGNASAGIFVSAVCFIPPASGTGTWTAPDGCYTARVTVVGGGGGITMGGRSHFNYPNGSTTGANQLFAEGGDTIGSQIEKGGSAGWNGVNNLAIGSRSVRGGGKGGSGGGGYGGGGGGSTTGGSGSAGGGGSFGDKGTGGSGGSGGVSGDGASGLFTPNSPYLDGIGGGSPTLSYAATLLSNFSSALSQKVGRGSISGGGGAGWCSAIVSITPDQSYSYDVGVGGAAPQSGSAGSYGMVVIEW